MKDTTQFYKIPPWFLNFMVKLMRLLFTKFTSNSGLRCIKCGCLKRHCTAPPYKHQLFSRYKDVRSLLNPTCYPTPLTVFCQTFHKTWRTLNVWCKCFWFGFWSVFLLMPRSFAKTKRETMILLSGCSFWLVQSMFTYWHWLPTGG